MRSREFGCHDVTGLLHTLPLLLKHPRLVFPCQAQNGPTDPTEGPLQGLRGHGVRVTLQSCRAKTSQEMARVVMCNPSQGGLFGWTRHWVFCLPGVSFGSLSGCWFPRVWHHILVCGRSAFSRVVFLSFEAFCLMSRTLAMSPTPSGDVSWLVGVVTYTQ